MKFTKTGRRGVALVAASTASALLFAGCSAGSLGSSGEGGPGRRHGNHAFSPGPQTPMWRARRR